MFSCKLGSLRAALLAGVAPVLLAAAPVFATELPNGVAAGDADQTSAVLWARSNTLGAMPFEISTKSDFSTLVGGAAIVQAITDTALAAKVEVSGLTAGTTYYYRATDAASNQSSGTFRTPVAAGASNPNGLRFGLMGDWRQDLAPYPAISNAASRNLDFAIKLGDTIYADVPSPGVPAAQATTLAEFRAKYNEAQSARGGLNTLAALNQSTQIYATIDDHEVTNNFAGAAPTGSDPRFTTGPGPLVNNQQLYQNGLQAFQEAMPIKAANYSGTGDAAVDGKPDLYRSRSFGKDAAMFIVDERSFRSAELAPVTNPANPGQVVPFLLNSFDPSRTMLGNPQFAQLTADLLAAQKSGVVWKFVAVPEPIQNLGPLGGEDRYEGYAAERTRLLKFIHDNNITNVVFLSADIHGNLVNNLTYQNGPFQPQIATSAFEVTTAAVAYDAPFGPTVAELAAAVGLLSPAQKAFYDSLPPAAQDQFIKQLVNAQLTPFGYDPLGLDGAADIHATLLKGDYVNTTTYGWTEFDLAPGSDKLTVTTYGIPYYTPDQIDADPALLSATPTIISQFAVAPTLTPEPAGMAMLGIGLLGLGLARRRR